MLTYADEDPAVLGGYHAALFWPLKTLRSHTRTMHWEDTVLNALNVRDVQGTN